MPAATVHNWRDPLTLGEKISLLREIVVHYVIARRVMRANELPAAAARIRAAATAVQPVSPADRPYAAVRLASAVNRVLGRLPTDSRCLVRSLVLTSLLARRGIESSLVIGARPSPTFAAHAWVEMDGRPLLPPGDARMQRLVEL